MHPVTNQDKLEIDNMGILTDVNNGSSDPVIQGASGTGRSV